MDYLIIGDIHGWLPKLEQLLTRAGFQKNSDGVYNHPSIKAIFIGDLIDRGEYQQGVLEEVKKMVDHGSAYIVMGNHELNAVGYSIKDPKNPTQYLRKHSLRNQRQHQAFLEAFSFGSDEYYQWIEWFKSLPLFLQFDEFNVIHAFWEENLINQLRPYLNQDGSLKEEYWHNVFDEDDPLYQIIEQLLKGLEIELPDGVFYHDAGGVCRSNARVKWWKLPNNDLSEIAIVESKTKDTLKAISPEISLPSFNLGDKLIFVGHYWMKGTPKILSDQVVCVDYSAAHIHNALIAYYFREGYALSNQYFISSDEEFHLPE